MAVETEPPVPFRFDRSPPNSLLRPLWPVARPILESLLAFPRLNRIHQQARILPADTSFFDRCLNVMKVAFPLPDDDRARIPRTGPLVIVANHPFGAVEGLILPAMLARVRTDFRILGNYLLGWIPEIRECLIAVDPFQTNSSRSRNVAPLREAVRWLNGGGALIVFPAGEVSHFRFRERRVTDPPWSPTIARLIRRTGSSVLPVFFKGRNRTLFQLAGLIHPRLRTLMLPRELLNKACGRIAVRVGPVLLPHRLARFSSDAAMTDYLRLRTYLLEVTDDLPESSPTAAGPARPPAPPVAEPIDPDGIASEIESLSPDHRLAQSPPFAVYLAREDEAPLAILEIGRLRELTFRPVGEGTGRPTDLDVFDAYYRHLFVWHDVEKRIIGAYRMGPTDEILPRLGIRGLYTHSLFRFKAGLIRQIGPALELGRSFVLPDFQRTYAPLMLLWRGIGEFVARFPRYRMLFGAVSISDRYQSVTKQILMAFLSLNFRDDRLARFVRPVSPPSPGRFLRRNGRTMARVITDLREVEELVAELESEPRGMPVLLRQYLKLNARLLGFNIDADFGNALDGLVVVDLAGVDLAILAKYLGSENAARFLAHHASRRLDPAGRPLEPAVR
jgi:putative hemolysin